MTTEAKGYGRAPKGTNPSAYNNGKPKGYSSKSYKPAGKAEVFSLDELREQLDAAADSPEDGEDGE